MKSSTALAEGRAAFDREAWIEAHGRLSEADAGSPLEAEDLERLAAAASLAGADEASVRAWTRAHSAFLEQGDALRAGRCAYRLAFRYLVDADQRAQGAGWLARAPAARRLPATVRGSRLAPVRDGLSTHHGGRRRGGARRVR